MSAFIIVPNWNGAKWIDACLVSLKRQTYPAKIVVVENGSTDHSLEFLQQRHPDIEIIVHQKNLGFAGGVNTGIKHALGSNADYIALLNNDAVVDKNWLKHLVEAAEEHQKAGIVTGKLLTADKKHIDSTGDLYTTWGLPFPRGRGETISDKYDTDIWVLGASGGASLYRTEMLREIGLFDEDFFAYYEDVDISFRAQLAGWKVLYEPKALAYHQQGQTSSQIKGFTTYQTFKNYPWLLWKNVPLGLLPRVLPRFTLAYTSILFSSLFGGRGLPALRGLMVSLLLTPKKLWQRWHIQRKRKVSTSYISSILHHDLPPNATKLRKLRSLFVPNKNGEASNP